MNKQIIINITTELSIQNIFIKVNQLLIITPNCPNTHYFKNNNK